jgi:hypothetical protein
MDARNPFSFSQALQPGTVFDPAVPDSQGQPVNSAAYCNDSVKRKAGSQGVGLFFFWSRLWTNFGPKPMVFVAMNQH